MVTARFLVGSDPEDAAAGRRLMDLSNRHRRTDPSYRSGDKFYTLQMSLHVLVDLIRYLHKDVPSKTYMAAFNQAKVNWVAAGAVKHALQAKYQPEMWRTLDPCLLQCVVMIPGTKRWVVSERHVDRLLAGLAEAKFPHRVIEFPGFPMFTDHNKFRTNRKAKPLRKMRIAKPGVALAHTGDGNPTLAGAREFHLIDALNEGKASLRYSPTEEQFEAHRADVERNLRNVIKRQEEANARRKAEKIIEPEPEPVPVWVKLAARTDAPALPPAEYLTPEPRTA